MIQVAGHWELGWNTPIKEIELWNLLLGEWGITNMYIWPVSGIKQHEHNLNLHERDSFKDIINDDGVKGLTRVYFEPYNSFNQKERGIDLREFEHPKNVLYIFGSNHFNPVIANKKEGDFVVQIPTIHNRAILWPHQCLAICCYDRLLKGWEGK